ncbi:MAG: NAD-dependent epimerase/dehydratase family protein [Candidatus Neomarinimicrobiota bacterium]
MRVFVAGGTGFVGGYVLEELVLREHDAVVLVRSGSERKLPKGFKGEIVSGDALNFSMPSDCDAVIHLIGILREFRRRGISFEKSQFQAAKAVADRALGAGVNRFILQSANRVRPDGTKYQYTKYLAEEYVKSKKFDWTIFRPSTLFGDPTHPSGPVGKPEFCTTLRDKMIKLPLPAPLFHPGLNLMKAGKFKLQPIHVKDLAKGIVASLDHQKSTGKIYPVGGKDQLTWHEIISLIADASGKKKWKVPAPGWAVKLMASLFAWIPAFPITVDQITMLMEGNTCDGSEFLSHFKIDPVPFNGENLSYLS